MSEKVADKTHARLGPSGWDWWSNCPGAPALAEGIPNKGSYYAAEGTVAHEIADRVLRGEIANPGELLHQTFQIDGFDIVVDDEMIVAVADYVSTVMSMQGDGILLPEQSLPIGHLTGEPGAEGTSDAIIIDGNVLKVIDLKYGKGVRVQAEGNGQARMYALGALEKFSAVYEIDTVETHIIMPRLEDGHTSATYSIGELEEFRDEVELAAGRVQLADFEEPSDGPNPDGKELYPEQWASMHLNPGEKQCKFCRAKGICPALKAEVSQSLALVSDCTAEDFADLSIAKQAATVAITPEVSGEKLAAFLRAVPLMEEAIKGVRAEVERRLFAGVEVPGFYLGEGKKGNRAWSNGAEGDVEATLKRKRLKVADIFEKKLVSPAKAEKLLKKENPKAWEAVQEYITQPDGKPSVCREGDKNPPYVPVTAADFADLTAQSEAERLLG